MTKRTVMKTSTMLCVSVIYLIDRVCMCVYVYVCVWVSNEPCHKEGKSDQWLFWCPFACWVHIHIHTQSSLYPIGVYVWVGLKYKITPCCAHARNMDYLSFYNAANLSSNHHNMILALIVLISVLAMVQHHRRNHYAKGLYNCSPSPRRRRHNNLSSSLSKKEDRRCRRRHEKRISTMYDHLRHTSIQHRTLMQRLETKRYQNNHYCPSPSVPQPPPAAQEHASFAPYRMRVGSFARPLTHRRRMPVNATILRSSKLGSFAPSIPFHPIQWNPKKSSSYPVSPHCVGN